jgi:hypothetical protein
MESFLVKGYSIESKVTKSAYDRKAVLFANTIVEELRKLGIPRDDIEIKTNILGNKNVPALLEFWTQGRYLRFSFSLTKCFIDNLYIISQLVKLEVQDVLEEKKTIQEFLEDFSESSSSKKLALELREAKELLGLDEKESNVELINQEYKKLARKHHPDAGGDVEEFKKINKAHKLIKKEMGI